jgi:Resolvase, N terminal domain
MRRSEKIRPEHLARPAFVYVRQSTVDQVRHHPESRRRQYDLAAGARALGWQEVVVIDEDLGKSGATTAGRTGFQRLVADVSLGRAGAVFSLEVSRLARNNRDWHQLLELCGLTDTVIVDADGIPVGHPGRRRGGAIVCVPQIGEPRRSRHGFLEHFQLLRVKLGWGGETGEVSTGTCQARDQPSTDGICLDSEDHGDRPGRRLRGPGRGGPDGDHNVHVQPRQLGGQSRKPVGSARIALLENQVLTRHIPEFAQGLQKGRMVNRKRRRGAGQDTDPVDPPRLLRLAGERRGEEAEGTRDKRSPVHYWMISSARASTAGGIVRPRAFAVLRLTPRVAPSSRRSPGRRPATRTRPERACPRTLCRRRHRRRRALASSTAPELIANHVAHGSSIERVQGPLKNLAKATL